MKDPWGYEQFHLGSLDIRTKEDEIVLEHAVPEGACYSGSPLRLSKEEALKIAFFIIKFYAGEVNEPKS